MARARIAVIDDHQIFLDGIGVLLGQVIPNPYAVELFGSPAQFLKYIVGLMTIVNRMQRRISSLKQFL